MKFIKELILILTIVAVCSLATHEFVGWVYPELERMAQK